MRAYQDMVFSTAVRLTANPAQAEDISQEVFLRAYESFSEVFSDDSRDEELESAAEVFDSVVTELEADERRARVEQALERLPDHQRIPLVLYHYEEMPYQDIADRLGISLAKVKTDILRGRVAMAGLLAHSGVGAPDDRPRNPSALRGAQS
jgi:RNA polymerase sigma-70 factor (ECF subfamily)